MTDTVPISGHSHLHVPERSSHGRLHAPRPRSSIRPASTAISRRREQYWSLFRQHPLTALSRVALLRSTRLVCDEHIIPGTAVISHSATASRSRHTCFSVISRRLDRNTHLFEGLRNRCVAFARSSVDVSMLLYACPSLAKKPAAPAKAWRGYPQIVLAPRVSGPVACDTCVGSRLSVSIYVAPNVMIPWATDIFLGCCITCRTDSRPIQVSRSIMLVVHHQARWEVARCRNAGAVLIAGTFSGTSGNVPRTYR